MNSEPAMLMGRIKFMSWLISEVEMVGKNKGNRPTTDDEAIAIMKKLVASIKQTYEATTEHQARIFLGAQIAIMNAHIPAIVTVEVVNAYIDEVMADGVSMKDAIAAVKEKFGQAVDMRSASSYIKQKLGA
jgi:hypothetical protein